MKIKIMFNKAWVDEKNNEGVLVVGLIDNWIRFNKFIEGVGCTEYSIIGTIDEKNFEGFVKKLSDEVVKLFDVSDPADVLECTLTNSLNQVINMMPQTDKKIFHEASKAEKMLSKILEEAPCKYSEELSNYLREVLEVVPMLKKMSALNSFWSQSLLVAMDDGYGLTEFLHALSRLYSALDITSAKLGGYPEPYEMRISATEQVPNINAYANWQEAVEKAKQMNNENNASAGSSPILCLDVSAWQTKLFSGEIKPYLRKLNAYSDNFTLVFKIPFMEEHAMNIVAEELEDVFSIHPIIVPPTSITNLIAYAKEQLAKRGFYIDDKVDEIIERMILQEKSDGSFFGFKTVDKIVDRIIYEKAKKNRHANDPVCEISYQDVASCVLKGDLGEKDPNEELKELVGMESVKQKIKEIVAQVKTCKQLHKDKKQQVSPPAIHMMFTGNPGTGKTTAARIVANIFRKEGILRKGYLIEVKGRDLCAEYLGQTAPKTSALCRDAYGSVLFIDEAYELFRGRAYDQYDYGLEALSTLIAEMENHRDDMCVILAGYSDEMKTMLSGNPGLESRIPFHIDFPNYSREEFFKIFFMMINNSGFKYEEPLEEAVREFFNKIPDSVISTKEFSNARFVRNLFERTWGKAACRSRLGEEDIKILVSDFVSAIENDEFKPFTEKISRNPIGFGF